MQSRTEAWIALGFLGLALGLALTVALNAAFGVIYDTHSFSDTLLLAGTAWRIHEGLTPGVDFGHLYGGIDAEAVALMMRLFGPSVAAIDAALIFGTVLFALAAAAILHTRATPLTFAAVVAVLTVLLLSRFPLEYDPLIRIHSDRAFIYNRIGQGAFLLSGLFVALKAQDDRWDFLAGAVVGALTIVALLAKPTFFVLAPAVLLGLLIQARWRGALAVLLAAGAMLLWLDPTLARWLGSIAYSQAQLAGDTSTEITALMRKAVQIPLANPLPTLLALLPLGVLLWAGPQRRALLGTVIVALAGLGMSSSMGANGSVGQLILPLAILTIAACFEIARSAAHPIAPLTAAGLVLLAASHTLPHAANTFGATLEGNLARDAWRIESGPFARYLSLPQWGGPEPISQYEMFADGLAALGEMEIAPGWAVAADRGISFELAAGLTPTPGYPLWQRPATPELAGDAPLSAEIKIVLLDRHAHDPGFQNLLRGKLTDFALCHETAHWEIFIRQDVALTCTATASPPEG